MSVKQKGYLKSIQLGLTVLLVTIALSLIPSLLTPKETTPRRLPSPVQSSIPSPTPQLQYKLHSVANSTIHTLLIPAQSHFQVTIALSPTVSSLSSFATQHNAIAVLNGGFFDPQNQQSTSYVTIQGQQVADPRTNDRLMQNPDLAPYLSKILDRSEFRRYHCAETGHDTIRYAIAFHSEPSPLHCTIADALGAGSRLLPNLTLEQEGFLEIQNGVVLRDALGSTQPNARSAIGITRSGDLLLALVAQNITDPMNSGLSLEALANFLKTLDVVEALNLDGGSSASLFYQGETMFGKVNDRGDPLRGSRRARVGRAVKSVLMVINLPFQ